MKKILALTLIGFVLVGCSIDEVSTKAEQTIGLEELTAENEKLKEINSALEKEIEQLENFSYLQDFSTDEIQAYESFLETGDVNNLETFPPEKVLLLYYHSLSIDDTETIYAITFDDGTLPDFATFSDQMNTSNFMQNEKQSVLLFRHYDSIQIREENQTEDHVNVELSISYGSHQHTRIYEVQKENNQWKIVLQHLL